MPEGTEDVEVNTPIAMILGEGESAGRHQGGARRPPAQPDGSSAPLADAPRRPRRRRRRRPASRRGAPRPETLPEPDVPEGTEMVTMTVREALRDAMAEEMRRDDNVFVMGEEVAEYQGAYKVTQGLLQEFGAGARDRHADHRAWLRRARRRRGDGGLKPIVEFMTFNFAMQAIDQIINSAAKKLYMSGGQMGCPIVFRGPNGAAARVGAQHSQDYSAWYSHVPGLKVIAPYRRPTPRGCSRPRSAIPIRWSSWRTRSSTASPARCRRSTTTWCRSARRRSCGPART